MADKRANIIITLQDLASSALGRLVGQFEKFKAIVSSIGSAIAPFAQFLVDSVKAYAESESAINRMNNALKNQGIYSAQLSTDMQDYAKELQQVTVHSDETAMETMTLLTTFGLSGAQMKEATEAAMNLSAGLGIDLHAATMLVGKAFAGSTDMLGRYGIKIREGIPEGEKFAEVMRQVQERFGNRAQSEMDTITGKVERLKNVWDEFKEVIGGGVLPIVSKVLENLTNLGSFVGNLGETFNNLKIIVAQTFADMIIGMLNFLNSQPLTSLAFKAMGMDIDDVKNKLYAWTAQFAVTETKSGQTAKKLLADNKLITKSAKENAAERKAIQDKELNDRIIAHDAQWVEDQKAIERTRLLEQKTNEQKLQALQNVLSQISTMQTAHNGVMFAVGKAAAIALAIVSTHQAAAQALTIMPPWVGITLAAMVEAAGMFQVAQIMGVQMAEGGIVMPRQGGTHAIIGEAGSAEAVIPLDSPAAQGMLGGSGITINAGVVIADQLSVREFARMIDKELYTLSRTRQTVNA